MEQNETIIEKKVITVGHANNMIEKLNEALLKIGAVVNEKVIKLEQEPKEKPWELDYLAESWKELDILRTDIQVAIKMAEKEK